MWLYFDITFVHMKNDDINIYFSCLHYYVNCYGYLLCWSQFVCVGTECTESWLWSSYSV